MSNPITPQEAQDLLDGATKGPWKWREHNHNRQTDIPDRNYDSLGNENRHALETTDSDGYASWVIASEEDKALMAAAPRLAATIAADTIQYGVENKYGSPIRISGESRWTTDKTHVEKLRNDMNRFHGDSIAAPFRIVARRVSPTWEVTE